MKLPEEIIIKPVITEKTLNLVETENQYTFIIDQGSNKIDVKKAVSDLFDVEVTKVRIVNTRGKKVRWGKYRTESRKSGFKKAIVTLKVGDKIELFDVK